jgi:ankyrin repeat protein
MFIRENNLDIVIYLVNNGLNLDNKFNTLLLYSVTNNCLLTLQYLISLGADIHFENDLLLLYACKCNRINLVELLLQYEFNDKKFLLFIETDLSPYRLIYGINVKYDYSNYFLIADKLIKNGFTIDNPTLAFCAYVKYASYCVIEEDVFIYFLEQGVDFNYKNKYDRYVLEEVISASYDAQLTKLCLQYGTDPYINNHGPLQIAVESNKLKSARLLLELNSTLTSIPECSITLEMKNLLKEFNIAID